MTSIVIPYQLADNGLELRYSLRSAERYLSGIGDVWLIGDRPDWYTGRHIPFVQRRGNIIWKQRNIYEKVLAVCAEPEISDTFLFMNDDHYLLCDYTANEFPWYYDDLMDIWIEQRVFGDYRETLINTTPHTSIFGLYADVHCPCLYEKDRFSALHTAEWSTPHGYAIKSMYLSNLEEERQIHRYTDLPTNNQPVQCPDLKIRYPMDRWELDKLLSGRSWFSTSDRCFNPDLKRLINELYPVKSRWEK